MHNVIQLILTSLMTFLLRAFPFLVFQKKETPKVVSYSGKVLPYAIMGMLVVYCLRNTSFLTPSYGLPELLGVAVTVIVHVWKRNTLFSIISGTICYMVLIQGILI